MELARIMNHRGEEVLVIAIHSDGDGGGEAANEAAIEVQAEDSAGESGLLYPSALRAALGLCAEDMSEPV